jgi:hypothetical protein
MKLMNWINWVYWRLLYAIAIFEFYRQRIIEGIKELHNKK